jgi:hypothetical protein
MNASCNKLITIVRKGRKCVLISVAKNAVIHVLS